MQALKNICIFYGSNSGKKNEIFIDTTSDFGKVLAERKMHLVSRKVILG